MLDLQHNLVSMLYAIKGMAENYFCRADENRFKDDREALEHARAALEKIYSKSVQAMGVAKRVSLSLKEQDKRDPAKSNTSLGEVWFAVVSLLGRKYTARNIELIQHIPREFPNIQCYRHDLVEILYYVSQNAMQAMKREGKLIVRANLEMSQGDEPMATIVIADTGPGMPQEILSNLFEPFFTTKSIKEGNGLGLCLVKTLVKRNGGKISVSSFEGCGTTFTISFPLAKLNEPRVKQDYVVAI